MATKDASTGKFIRNHWNYTYMILVKLESTMSLSETWSHATGATGSPGTFHIIVKAPTRHNAFA